MIGIGTGSPTRQSRSQGCPWLDRARAGPGPSESAKLPALKPQPMAASREVQGLEVAAS